MNTDHQGEQSDHAKLLRKQAEDALIGKPVDLNGMHPDDIKSVLYELQVHQTELTLQNDELRRIQLELAVSLDLYSDLYNFAPSGYCTLSQKGHILNANLTLAELLGVDRDRLLHHLLSDFVDPDFQDEYYLHWKRASSDHRRTESEIQMVKPDGERVIVRMESVIARGDPTHHMVMLDDITAQRRLEKQQQESATQMVLQRRLIEQSEMERGELARNLHDGPIQGLASLGFSIQIIKEILKEHGVDGDANLDQLGDDIKNLIIELRNITNNLRPPVLSKFGLGQAIKENVEDLQAKYPRTRINLDVSDDPDRLPDYKALALYRIYQQALNNVFLHANASEVWVRLKIDPKQTIFEVQDNGKGIPRKIDFGYFAREGHLGLVGMKERSEAIGGQFMLISEPDEGLLVRVTIPNQA